MPSDQQKMYDYASDLVKLQLSELPEEEVLSQIGEIVVGGLSLWFPSSSKNMQRKAVETVRRAATNKILMHVPTILLSAAAEFDMAYGTGGNLKPQLSRISENDQRAKSSSWYQPPLHPRCHTRDGMLQVKFYAVITKPNIFVYSYTLSWPAAVVPKACPALPPDGLRPMPRTAEDLQHNIDSVLRCLPQRPTNVHNRNSTFGVSIL